MTKYDDEGDHYATLYGLRKKLHRKEYKIACGIHFGLINYFYGKECDATSQKELVVLFHLQGETYFFLRWNGFTCN